MTRGYFGIGIEFSNNPLNLGTLWRSARIYGAAFIFTVGVIHYDDHLAPPNILNDRFNRVELLPHTARTR